MVFRDGVAEGQLPYTVGHEVQQLQLAFDTVALPDGAKYTPKFTIVVVQKRTNSRFFVRNVSTLKKICFWVLFNTDVFINHNFLCLREMDS